MDFNEFHKWVQRELGINLSAYKPEQLNRRINSIMTRNGISCLSDYTKAIKNEPVQKQKFLDFITINVTEFFRNPELFKQLQKLLKDELLVKNRNLKIWSAACSIGCEPYTIAMILNELTPHIKHTIIATDIDSTILKKAKKAEYTKNELKSTDDYYIKKYFNKEDNKYILNNSIKSMVTFKKQDLIMDQYEKEFDLIVCRNVVIYFNNDTKESIYRRFSQSLKKGGMLFVGATESIYNYKDYNFEKASTFIYKKI
ncbi:protein-glutamate O-methyltransferase CheR [Clostridium sp. BJN0001]|uniref:CheR family methyltransferase n=1 Tax=Clostridium sp. BJN0001 TaxID=2930219 RepID=UPI001FD02BC6|nr:protein-glutamate O-methyltransferase CheR [Clostridium sp. BJN0001]